MPAIKAARGKICLLFLIQILLHLCHARNNEDSHSCYCFRGSVKQCFFIVVAMYKSVHAYILVAQGRIEEKPGVVIAESLDSFMVALFFINY